MVCGQVGFFSAPLLACNSHSPCFCLYSPKILKKFCLFCRLGPVKPNDETNNANEHNIVKNPNWREADQLTISSMTEKQLQLGGQSGTCNLQPLDFKCGALSTQPHCLRLDKGGFTTRKTLVGWHSNWLTSTTWIILHSFNKHSELSFNAFFPPFQLAESPPRNLQITAYK